MLLSGIEKPSICFVLFNIPITRPSLFSFVSFLRAPPKPSSHLPSLSATRISTNEPATELNHARKNPRISNCGALAPVNSQIFSRFPFYMASNFLIKIWVAFDSFISTRGWVLRARSSRRLSVTSSLKASATSALKILAILATVTASCRFAPCLPDAWCFSLEFYCYFSQDLRWFVARVLFIYRCIRRVRLFGFFLGQNGGRWIVSLTDWIC